MKRFMISVLTAIIAVNLHAGDIQKGKFRSKWDEEEAMEKERSRQINLRERLEMIPEQVDKNRRLRRLMGESERKERFPETPSLETSPGRYIEYSVARELEEKPYPYHPRAWAKRDFDTRRAKKLEAYEKLELNAPVPTVSLEPIGIKNMPFVMEQTTAQQQANEKGMAKLERLYRAQKHEAYKKLEPNAPVPKVDLTPIEERARYALPNALPKLVAQKPGYLEYFIKGKRVRNPDDELAYKKLELNPPVPWVDLTPIEDRSYYYQQYGPRYSLSQPVTQPAVQKQGYFERFSNWLKK